MQRLSHHRRRTVRRHGHASRAGDVHIPALIDVAKILFANIDRRSDTGACSRAPAMLQCAVWFADDQSVHGDDRWQYRECFAGCRRNASDCACGWSIGETGRRQVMRRRMPLDQFVTAEPYCAEWQLLIAVECDALPGYGGSFEKWVTAAR
jgi:hypothetical protein